MHLLAMGVLAQFATLAHTTLLKMVLIQMVMSDVFCVERGLTVQKLEFLEIMLALLVLMANIMILWAL
jgi:hypothetical protein